MMMGIEYNDWLVEKQPESGGCFEIESRPLTRGGERVQGSGSVKLATKLATKLEDDFHLRTKTTLSSI
jgi:hypothetical protein